MYKVGIYSIDGSTPVTTFLEGEVMVEGWGKKINAAGSMSFSVHVSNAKATEANLQQYYRTRLYRLRRDGSDTYDLIWYGYIQATKQQDSRIEVLCTGCLDLFKKRLTPQYPVFTMHGNLEAFTLLTTTNTGSVDTGIVTGTGVTTNVVNLVMDETDIFSAWTKLAQASLGEFEIDDTGALNFVPTLGTDKTASIFLRFRTDGTPGGNTTSLQIGEDGEPMANCIIATSGDLRYQANDLVSQGIYGVLMEHKEFTEAQDIDTLTAMAEAYLTQRAYPIPDYQVQPDQAERVFNTVTGAYDVTGLQYGDVVVGDLVTIDVATQYQTVTEARRIAEIAVTVDENGKESVAYTLSKAGVFITAATFGILQTQQDLKQRVQQLEYLIA